MNYLFRYVQLLDAGEILSLATLDLTPRERSVLDAVVGARARSDVAREELLPALAITSSHFDKICSVLLRRVYAAIVPAGGTALLYDLNRRGLHASFLHELRRQEREIAREPAQRRADFYMESFNILGRICRKDHNESLMVGLARKYQRLRPSPDNALFFEACMVSSLIWDAAARGANDEVHDEAERRLRKNAGRITPETGPVALYKHYQAYALFHAQIDPRPDERLRYLQLAADIAGAHPALFTEEERALGLCRIAESYYFNSNAFTKAHRLYATLFRRHRAVLGHDYYHTTKFIQICIILGRHAEAERLLKERFSRHLSSEHESIGTMGAISWSKLLLASGRVAEARSYIEFGFQRNRKNFYTHYEIELRMLQSAYFTMTGDREFAGSLVERNAKYLRSKGYTLANSRFYPWFFKLLRTFLDDGALSPDLERKLAEFEEGPAAVYGILLHCARESLAASPQA